MALRHFASQAASTLRVRCGPRVHSGFSLPLVRSFSTVLENLKYAKSHEWVRVEGDEVYVGITDHAQTELGDVVHIEVKAAIYLAVRAKTAKTFGENHTGPSSHKVGPFEFKQFGYARAEGWSPGLGSTDSLAMTPKLSVDESTIKGKGLEHANGMKEFSPTKYKETSPVEKISVGTDGTVMIPSALQKSDGDEGS